MERCPGTLLHSNRMDTIQARLLTKAEAAAYCRVKSTRTFDRWRKMGLVPPPIPGTHRWDRKSLDAHLDHVSGLSSMDIEANELDRWMRENGYGD
jgi:hypothetical protein